MILLNLLKTNKKNEMSEAKKQITAAIVTAVIVAWLIMVSGCNTVPKNTVHWSSKHGNIVLPGSVRVNGVQKSLVEIIEEAINDGYCEGFGDGVDAERRFGE